MQAGDYRLLVNTDLEDPSGNSIRSLFEIDDVDRGSLPSSPTTSVVPFAITTPR